MPVYEYQCVACGEEFSKYFKSRGAAVAPVACVHCGAANARRAISAFQVHQTLTSQIERLDPRFEREIDAAERPHKATDPLNRVNLDFTPPGSA